jgi:hypothetical protein
MCPHDAHTHTSQFKLVFGATACAHFKIQQSITGQFDYLSPTILVMATEILKKKKKRHSQIKKSGKVCCMLASGMI